MFIISLSFFFSFSLLKFSRVVQLAATIHKEIYLMQASGECSAYMYGDDSYNTPISLSLSLSAEGAPTGADQVSCLAGDCSSLSSNYADIWGMSLTTYSIVENFQGRKLSRIG